jgi:hypothetical protein
MKQPQTGNQKHSANVAPQRESTRFSSPTQVVDGRTVIDVRNYVPYFFAAINNALSRGASHEYLSCPSSYKMGHQSGLRNGGSGSFV